MKFRSIVTSAALLLAAASANATYNIVIREVGADVVMTGNGSIDTMGMALAPFVTDCGGGLGGVGPASPAICVGNGSTGLWDPTAITGFPHFGAGGLAVANASTGAPVVAFVGGLRLPAGYTSGAPLAGSSTFTGTTLAALGIAVGTYTITLSSGDSIVIYAGTVPPAPAPVASPAGVPTLSEYAMMALASLLAISGLIAMRRRQA